ncbi:MAG: hypothetical protein WGN25_19680 [Candidatus Electrothrix sp. GW3-4]|uniref:hypothetical protein n=1 Tax=Candidatus Electrothrix sp. GW3-4 TaxID=3126740 RepID=UPI0030D2AFC6
MLDLIDYKDDLLLGRPLLNKKVVMKFRELSFWDKIAALGAIASIVGLFKDPATEMLQEAIKMNLLLAAIAGSLIGVVVTRTEDTFMDSFKKWLKAETKGDSKKKTDIEYDIEKSLPNFSKWVTQQKEEKRRSKRKYVLYYLLALNLMVLIYIMQLNL